MEYRTVGRPKHGRRSKLDIVGDILRVVAEGSEKPTNVMFRANLTWPLTLAYLELLLRHKMLNAEVSGSKLVYRITPKGSELLRSFVQLEEGAAELELDVFDSALFTKAMTRPKRAMGVPLSLDSIQADLEAQGYARAGPTLRGLSGVEHSFDLVMVNQAGVKFGHLVVDKAAVSDVIRAFILQTDLEIQVRLVSKGQPEADAEELAKTYGVNLVKSG